MRRLLPYIILVSIFSAVSYIGYILYIKPKPPEPFKINYDFTENISSSTSPTSECDPDQSIEYVTYSGSDLLWKENNKFGLYVYAEVKDFFEIAQELVNSNGGEWGYVLIPYNVQDQDYTKWSRVFSQLINKKLIPVIQLWGLEVDDYKNQTKEAAKFLNKFIWPIKYRYISVYNEPNDEKFWYGDINPWQYAEILDHTIKVLKETNQDFFILNGALNVSASTSKGYMDSFEYMKKMNDQVPGIFDKLDGWASHPYPQPNFSGNPYDKGRWSIRAYEEELEFLKNELSVKKDLPVFITETGWAHAEGSIHNFSYPSVKTVADNFKIAYEEVWLKDERVRAVMPFTIRYDPPFDHFSWVNRDYVPYYHYDVIKDMKKVKGKPPYLYTETLNLSTCE